MIKSMTVLTKTRAALDLLSTLHRKLLHLFKLRSMKNHVAVVFFVPLCLDTTRTIWQKP
jgi:hypothetical protein